MIKEAQNHEFFTVCIKHEWEGNICIVVVPEKQDAEATALKWTIDKAPDGTRYEPKDIFISGPYKFGEDVTDYHYSETSFDKIIKAKKQ